MQRAIVTAVRGSRICTNGRWLTAIGNKTFHPGDAVWTDGRCVYGNISGGGAAAVILRNEYYVPILLRDGSRAVYHKGKLNRYGKGQPHKLMASNGSSFCFADGDVLDLHLDGNGNGYALQGGEYRYHDIGDGDSFEDQDGQPGVVLNGRMEHPIDLIDYSGFCYDYACEEAVIIETPLSGSTDVTDIINKVYLNSCALVNGWYESEDSYCYILDCYAKGEHIDAINYRGNGEADWGFFVDFDSFMWVMVTPKSIKPLWASTVRDVDEDDNVLHIERDRYRIFTDGFTLPLPNGYYIEGTKDLPENTPTEYSWWKMFSGKLYSPQKQLLCESYFDMSSPIRLGKLKKGAWLMTEGDILSLLKGGRKNVLSYDVRNSRLHPMKNKTKWIKGE